MKISSNLKLRSIIREKTLLGYPCQYILSNGKKCHRITICGYFCQKHL